MVDEVCFNSRCQERILLCHVCMVKTLRSLNLLWRSPLHTDTSHTRWGIMHIDLCHRNLKIYDNCRGIKNSHMNFLNSQFIHENTIISNIPPKFNFLTPLSFYLIILNIILTIVPFASKWRYPFNLYLSIDSEKERIRA